MIITIHLFIYHLSRTDITSALQQKNRIMFNNVGLPHIAYHLLAALKQLTTNRPCVFSPVGASRFLLAKPYVVSDFPLGP